MHFYRKCYEASMAIPYIPKDIIEKYFDNYVNSQHQYVLNESVLHEMVTTILEREEDGERIRHFDLYMSYPGYAAYWEPFHNFIVYVRLQRLIS
jgi:hypothetical protein